MVVIGCKLYAFFSAGVLIRGATRIVWFGRREEKLEEELAKLEGFLDVDVELDEALLD